MNNPNRIGLILNISKFHIILVLQGVSEQAENPKTADSFNRNRPIELN